MLEGLVYEQTKAPQVVVVRSKLSSSDANERTNDETMMDHFYKTSQSV